MTRSIGDPRRAALEARARERLEESGITPHTISHPDDDSAFIRRRVWWTNALLVALIGLLLFQFALGEIRLAKARKQLERAAASLRK